jgi:hypothetical protein
MFRRLVLLAATLGVLAVLAAGCGGSDDSDETTQWADSLCTAMTTWTQSLSDAASSIQGNGLSRSAIQSAIDDAKTATQTFVDDLRDLGAPDTQAGADAQDAINDLASDLSDDIDDAQSAVEQASTLPGAISAVTNALTTMSNQVSSTFTELGQLDPKGELEQAFGDAESCKSLTG